MRDSFYDNNPRSNKDRPTPTVRPVNRSEELLKVLQDIISNPRKSQNVKKRFMAGKAGGYCSVCGDIATQIESYNIWLVPRLWKSIVTPVWQGELTKNKNRLY
jgi:hypothetical protein